MPRPIKPVAETNTTMHFPVGGVDVSRGLADQPKNTCVDALNVRAFDWQSDRARGGARPGITRFLDERINAPVGPGGGVLPFSIQDITQIRTGPADHTALAGPFVYSNGNALTFSLGTSGGVNYYTDASVVGTLRRSCWDAAGNCYCALFGSGGDSGLFPVTKADSSGAGAEVWRNDEMPNEIFGIVHLDGYVYVAVTDDTTHAIYRLSAVDGTGGSAPWVTNATSGFSAMEFASSAVNVLAAARGLLGVVCYNGTSDNFLVVDPVRAVVVASTGSQGTRSDVACRADSDGEFFYASICTTGRKVQKITTEGTVVWTYVGANDDNTIAYDRYTHRVFVLDKDAGTVRGLNADTGEVQNATFSPGALSTWDAIDTDWQGNVVLWANGTATNTVVAVNAELGTLWGPVDLASGTQTGCSCYRGTPLTSRSRILVTAGGKLYRITRTTKVAVSGGQAWDANAEVVFSSQNGFYHYYVDGRGYSRYNSDTDAVEAWTASAGALPRDEHGHAALLIERWRGRIVLSGLLRDPNNWFMSAVDDPTDWDYSPAFQSATQAVAGNNAYQGLVGVPVRSLIAYSDDLIIFGGDHELWAMSGDPMQGGTLDNISETIGTVFGRPFAKGPDGTLWFFSSGGEVIGMTPGSQPVSISQPIRSKLQKVHFAESIVRMAWDDRDKGLHLYITPFDKTQYAQHWFWGARENAWQPVVLARKDFNPKAVWALDEDDPNDRVILIGSWDSYVRVVGDKARTTDTLGVKADGRVGLVEVFDAVTTGMDDGYPFDSFVVLGPIMTKAYGEVMLHEVQAILAEKTNTVLVAWEVFAGNSCEDALSRAAVDSGTLFGGRNPTFTPRVAGHAVYLKLSARGAWAMETVRVRLQDLGAVRRRGL